MEFDYIVAGAGSAGCVVAHRLSSAPETRVALIEAGKDYPPGREPPELLDSFAHVAFMNPAFTWPELRVQIAANPTNHADTPAPLRRYEQARVIGGGSSINGMMANRGMPDDYAEWVALGARGWAWDDVLPYFKRLEHDLDFDGPLHGKDGRILVRRLFPEIWPGFTRAAGEALAASGYRYLADQNGEFGDGYFPIPISNVLDRRVSAATAYLDPTTRRRPNLAIFPETRTERLLTEGRRVVGVRIHRDGGASDIRAREVIVSAGALHSPAILLRSGIGPAADLRALGIAVVADRPGVGRNLMEHPSVSVAAYLRPEARLPACMRRQMIVALRYSSGIADCPATDMFMVPANKAAWHPLGARLGALMVWVNKSYSKGHVRLRAPAAHTPPEVFFNMLSDRRDLERLKQALRLMHGLYAKPSLGQVVTDPFPATLSDRVRKVGAVSRANFWKTRTLAAAMDASPALRRHLIRRVITLGTTLDELLADDRAMEAWLFENVTGTWHPSCTLRMGAADDPYAVADPAGRIYGVDGLRACDASVMPCVPRANTNLPTMMIAEKISQAILDER